MAFQQLQVGGGAGNIGKAYSNTNQLFGYNAFKAPSGFSSGGQALSPQQIAVGNTGATANSRQDNFNAFAAAGKKSPQRVASMADALKLGRTMNQSGAQYGDTAYTDDAGEQYVMRGFDTPTGTQAERVYFGAGGGTGAQQTPINTWQQKLGSDAVQAQRKPPSTAPVAQGLIDKSYIQLANILNTGQADRYGVSDEDLVNAMESIKQSSYNG